LDVGHAAQKYYRHILRERSFLFHLQSKLTNLRCVGPNGLINFCPAHRARFQTPGTFHAAADVTARNVYHVTQSVQTYLYRK